MISYKDMTFCSFYKECKEGKTCERALTPRVKKEAEIWWGEKGAPILRFVDKPDCFEGIPLKT